MGMTVWLHKLGSQEQDSLGWVSGQHLCLALHLSLHADQPCLRHLNLAPHRTETW